MPHHIIFFIIYIFNMYNDETTQITTKGSDIMNFEELFPSEQSMMEGMLSVVSATVQDIVKTINLED